MRGEEKKFQLFWTTTGSFLTENAPSKIKNHPISMIFKNFKIQETRSTAGFSMVSNRDYTMSWHTPFDTL
jgi:hypothetical protein